MYIRSSAAQSNPPSGTGRAVFGGGGPVRDGARLGGPADESACAGSLSAGKDECWMMGIRR
jgi:hypothetical protein